MMQTPHNWQMHTGFVNRDANVTASDNDEITD